MEPVERFGRSVVGRVFGKSRYATPPTALRLWAPPSYVAEGGTFFRRISPPMPIKFRTPSLGVPPDGPQTPISPKNVVWGACRWTPDDDIPQKRRLRCLPMDPKHQYPSKTSFEVPADGPQTPISLENVVWGACRWTPNGGWSGYIRSRSSVTLVYESPVTLASWLTSELKRYFN